MSMPCGKHALDPAGANWWATASYPVHVAFWLQPHCELIFGLTVSVCLSVGGGREQCTTWRFPGWPVWCHPAVAYRWGADACSHPASPGSTSPGAECVPAPVSRRPQHTGLPQPATQPQVGDTICFKYTHCFPSGSCLTSRSLPVKNV